MARVDSREPLRLSVQPGRELPLHAGASQKMLLANLPVMETQRVLDAPLPPLCSHTITDPDSLRMELSSIRQRGWASSCEETNRGVWGLAVGLIDDQRAGFEPARCAGADTIRLSEYFPQLGEP